MYDKSLRLKLFPSELIVKNFVRGEAKCNYEHYLLELVNNSIFFLNLSQGEQYLSPLSESHGECDCIANAYQMDFKLIGGKTPLQARSILADQKSLMAKGVVAVSPPKAENSIIEATLIHVGLRDYSYIQLCELRKQKPKKQGVENDIYHLLVTLEKKKNLFLLFPYFLNFDARYELQEGSEQIREALNCDFRSAMQYRHSVAQGYDTYLSFIYNEYLIVLQETTGEFKTVDYISLDKSPTYMKLLDYTRTY